MPKGASQPVLPNQLISKIGDEKKVEQSKGAALLNRANRLQTQHQAQSIQKPKEVITLDSTPEAQNEAKKTKGTKERKTTKEAKENLKQYREAKDKMRALSKTQYAGYFGEDLVDKNFA